MKTIERLCITDKINKRTQKVPLNFATICEKIKGFFVLRKWKSVINLQQLYAGYKDFKHGKIKVVLPWPSE